MGTVSMLSMPLFALACNNGLSLKRNRKKAGFFLLLNDLRPHLAKEVMSFVSDGVPTIPVDGYVAISSPI